jgi:hypothetical protein
MQRQAACCNKNQDCFSAVVIGKPKGFSYRLTHPAFGQLFGPSIRLSPYSLF